MSDWTAGYVADIGYTYGYYTELNPQRIRLALLNAGLAFPESATACELGFGQGLSINIHSAASATHWYGTDFNPAQAGFAQELAAASGSAACLYDESFAEFCQRRDLPDFDFIALHGIWSWISAENQQVIVDFVRRKLKVGGVLYISYNTMPGWAAMVPMRQLLAEHAEVMAVPGRGIVSRIDAALEFAEKLLATQPMFGRAHPGIPERLKRIKQQNRNYLAHEYFNRDWQPMSFADMAERLEPAKLNFACSAHFVDHVDSVNLTADQQQFLWDIPDPMFRETVRDFMTNQQFRRDYWVKGPRQLAPLEQAEALRRQRLVLVTPRADVSLTVTGAQGEGGLQEAVYGPVLDLLGDHKPKTLGQIEEALSGRGIGFAQLVQAAIVLTGKGNLQPAAEDKAVAAAKPVARKLNAFLMNKARGSTDVNYLASPATGGGLAVPRFHQLFLLAGSKGRTAAPDRAAFAWQVLGGQGQRIIREGKILETAEDNLAELNREAGEFMGRHLPVLEALGVAP